MDKYEYTRMQIIVPIFIFWKNYCLLSYIVSLPVLFLFKFLNIIYFSSQ